PPRDAVDAADPPAAARRPPPAARRRSTAAPAGTPATSRASRGSRRPGTGWAARNRRRAGPWRRVRYAAGAGGRRSSGGGESGCAGHLPYVPAQVNGDDVDSPDRVARAADGDRRPRPPLSGRLDRGALRRDGHPAAPPDARWSAGTGWAATSRRTWELPYRTGRSGKGREKE